MNQASVPFPSIPNFGAITADLLQQVPWGCVTTYGDIAIALGDKLASRYVGQFMLDHDHSATCACHRVVRADGQLGKYISGDERDKATRLKAEGLSIVAGRVNLRHKWSDFRSAFPLQTLRAYQVHVAQCIDLTPRILDTTEIAGVDVSFMPNSDTAVAAMAIVDTETLELTYHLTRSQRVTFPYLSGYLAFRELPLLRQLIHDVRTERTVPAIIMVDGSGILHPCGCGIASMLGVEEMLSTIGVTKKHLCGRVANALSSRQRNQRIFIGKQLSGYAMRPRSGSRQRLFVSPGSHVDMETVVRVLDQTCVGRRLPEPIYWADRLSRQAARQPRYDVRDESSPGA